MDHHFHCEANRSVALKFTAQLFVSRFKVLRDDARFSDGRHEISVSGPARHDVNVNMIDYPGAGSSAEVHAKVESGGIIRFAQRGLGTLGEIHEVVRSFFSRPIEVADVLVGHNQKMAADVWVDIEDYEIMFRAMEHKVHFIAIRIVANSTKDALRIIGGFPA